MTPLAELGFVRSEKWEFNGQRLYVEVSVELEKDGHLEFTIKSHASLISLEDLIIGNRLDQRPLRSRIVTILEYLNVLESSGN